jgi:hypothetical protein
LLVNGDRIGIMLEDVSAQCRRKVYTFHRIVLTTVQECIKDSASKIITWEIIRSEKKNSYLNCEKFKHPDSLHALEDAREVP